MQAKGRVSVKFRTNVEFLIFLLQQTSLLWFLTLQRQHMTLIAFKPKKDDKGTSRHQTYLLPLSMNKSIFRLRGVR